MCIRDRLYSQAATVRALMPLGIALGISPMILVALFPAVNGYFFIPNYPTVVAVSYTHLLLKGKNKKNVELVTSVARAYLDAGQLKDCLLYTSRCV